MSRKWAVALVRGMLHRPTYACPNPPVVGDDLITLNQPVNMIHVRAGARRYLFGAERLWIM